MKYNKDSCRVICNIHAPHQLFPEKPSFLFSQLCGFLSFFLLKINLSCQTLLWYLDPLEHN